MTNRVVPVFMLVVISVIWTSANAQVPEWVSRAAEQSSLADSHDADSSLLYATTRIGMNGDTVVLQCRQVIRILTAEGLENGMLTLQYDEQSDHPDVSGWRLDEQNRLVEELDKDNIHEIALNLSFVDDSRQLVARFDNVEKGDVVAFRYQLERKTLFRDLFVPLAGDYEVVRHEISLQGGPRFAVLNDPSGYARKLESGVVVENVPVLKPEVNQPPLADRVPVLAVSYHPEGETWQTFGRHYWNLTGNRLQLTPEGRRQAENVVTFKNRAQYISDVIDFVAGGINYVDIELGVGGYIPHACSDVLDKRYGDCKDMAFLAAALLRMHDIRAYPVLAQARRHGRVYAEFPGNQFNHVILGIALDENERDLANSELDGQPWLFSDLTNRITKPPFLPDGLEGTRALIATEEGGKLVTLPWSPASRNHVRYEIKAGLRYNGSVGIELREINTGQPAFDELRLRDKLTEQKEKRAYRSWVQKMIPGAELKALEVKSDDGNVRTRVEMVAPRYGVETGDGLYMVPNVLYADAGNPYPRGKRVWPIRRGILQSRDIHVEWYFPPAFSLKEVPGTMEIDNEYYTLRRTVQRESGRLTMDYHIGWKVSEVPALQYRAYRSAYRKFVKAFKAPVLVDTGSR